jgi:aspartate/methionine/tyrosine aminotransferase
MLAKRIKNLEESGIRKIFSLASANQGGYINLSLGQPHFNVPRNLKKAAKAAIDKNLNAYAPTIGLEKLREKIAQKLIRENKIKALKEEIIIASGVSGALLLAFGALLDPGDEIIMPDPYFVLYKELLNFLGVKIKFLDTYPDFHLKGIELERLVTKKTKAILVNSPNNPTGAVYGEAELKEAARIAKVHGLVVISDEIYEKFAYGKKFFSIGSIYKKTVTVNGFSKSHAVPGWRVGFAHGPKEIIEAMNKLQQYTFVCAPAFAQAALAQEFNPGLEAEYENYKKKRDFIYESLKNKYELNKPEGAFYAFVRKPKSRKDFINECVKNKLLVVPGAAFSRRNDYFRISFAASDKDLESGVKILNKLA